MKSQVYINLFAGRQGMTLLEVLITLVILVTLVGMSAGLVKRKESQLKKTFRTFMALNRQLDYTSRLTGKSWRWAFNLDKEKNEWWVEIQKPPKQEPLNQTESLPVKEDTDKKDLANEAEDEPSKEGFVRDKDFFKKPQKLPTRITFESLHLSEQEEPIKTGKAYIYYLPEGQFNHALLTLKYKKTYWSLFFNRLNGQLMILPGQKTLLDLKQ